MLKLTMLLCRYPGNKSKPGSQQCEWSDRAGSRQPWDVWTGGLETRHRQSRQDSKGATRMCREAEPPTATLHYSVELGWSVQLADPGLFFLCLSVLHWVVHLFILVDMLSFIVSFIRSFISQAQYLQMTPPIRRSGYNAGDCAEIRLCLSCASC